MEYHGVTTPRRGLIRMVTLPLVFGLGFVLGSAALVPMTWLDYAAVKLTGGALRLANATGNLWNGTGVITIGKSVPQAILGPLSIRIRPSVWPLGIRISLSGEGVRWEQTQDIRLLANGEWVIPGGQATLLSLDFSNFAGMVGLSRLTAEPSIAWPTIVWRSGALKADKEVTVTFRNVSSALTPIKPLADINARFQMSTAGLGRWSLASTSTSLLDIAASGNWEDATGKGAVRCRRYCDYVSGLLGLIGKRLGDDYVFVLGPR